jgi:hypothetical protein
LHATFVVTIVVVTIPIVVLVARRPALGVIAKSTVRLRLAINEHNHLQID